MIIRQVVKDDFARLVVQDEQKHEFMNIDYPKKTSFTLEENGKVLGIFGYTEIYKGRGTVFSFISKDAGRGMLKIVRNLRHFIRQGMEKTGVERLEMSVLEGFGHGDKFARLLGFECEGLMKKYYKGKNYKLYARVR